MNMRNAEHNLQQERDKERDKEEEDKECANLIESAGRTIVSPTSNEQLETFLAGNAPTCPSYNNPFAEDYVFSGKEEEFNIDNLSGDLQGIVLEEPALKPQVQPVEIPVQNNARDEIMQNPLDLNFGASSVEQKIDEPELVSPVKEPEVMSSKFAEENFISETVEQQQQQQQQPFSEMTSSPPAVHPDAEVHETKASQPPEALYYNDPIEDSQKKSINLSESLQEFTGLEDQLSPMDSHCINLTTEKLRTLEEENLADEESRPPSLGENLLEEAPILKENLVEEPKDVEEVQPLPVVAEAQLDEIPLVTNEPEATEILIKQVPDSAAPPASTPIETAAVAATAAVGVAAAATAAAAAAAAPTTLTGVESAASKARRLRRYHPRRPAPRPRRRRRQRRVLRLRKRRPPPP
jgi:hypothetical protein